MEKSLYKYAKKSIKQAFPKYKRVQVGATLKTVEVTRKRKVIRYIGFDTYDDVVLVQEHIPIIKFKKICMSVFGLYEKDVHQLYVAVDQKAKTVYWNFERC